MTDTCIYDILRPENSKHISRNIGCELNANPCEVRVLYTGRILLVFYVYLEYRALAVLDSTQMELTAFIYLLPYANTLYIAAPMI